MSRLHFHRSRSLRSRLLPTLLDRYLLRQLLPALLLCLGTVLVALLLERLLRLFDLLAQNNQALPAVVRLIVDLVPHYLGLALPAAFLVSLFMVVARLGDDNELDAYLAGGQSIARLTRPFIVVAFVLSLFSGLLFGYLQPYARYAYHAVLYTALNSGWDARLQAGTFANAGKGYTLTSDEVDASGRQLRHVFIRRVNEGLEEITTGESGALMPSADGRQLILNLINGEQFRDRSGAELDATRFSRMESHTAFTSDAPPFRDRGGSERELTFGELLRPTPPSSAGGLTKARLSGELQARIARALSLPLLPLLAVPLGMSAKRGKRTASLIVAAVLMLMFHHSLQLGESLAESGTVPALFAVWLPWFLFAGFCGWLFSQSLARPGDNPVTRFVLRVEELSARMFRKSRHKPSSETRGGSDR